MENPQKPKGILVTGVIGEDVHVIGIRIMEYEIFDVLKKVASAFL